MIPQSYSRSFIKDNAIVIAGHILIYMHGIILMPIIIKTVGVTIYGGFVLLSSVLGITFGLSSLGAGFRAKRFMPSAQDMTTRRDLFYPQFFFQMVSVCFLSLLLMLLNRPINTFFFKGDVSYSVFIIPLFLVFYCLYSQGSDYFRYTSRVHYMTAATLSFPYIHIGLILLFFYCYGYININVLVLAQALSAFLIVIPCFLIIFREIGLKFLLYRVENLISDIKLGFPLVLGFIVDFILAASDRYVIALYMTVLAVGSYNPGYVLGSAIIFIPKAMGTALPQLMSRAVDSENQYDAERMLNYAIKIFLLLAIPFVFGSMILGRPILTLLANSEVAEMAYLITPIVALGTLFYGLNVILSNALFVRMKTYAMFKMNLIASIFNLLANLFLLYFFRNIIVAAITSFFSYGIAFMYINKIVTADWPVDFQPVVILKSVAASLFMAALLFWVSDKTDAITVSMVAGQLMLGVVVYIVGLFALGTFTKKELQFVKSWACRLPQKR